MATEMWQRLRAARKAANLTQLQVARALGLTRSGYAFLEWSRPEGRTNPSATQLRTISELTKVPVGMLMDDTVGDGDIFRVGTAAAQGLPAPVPGVAVSSAVPTLNADRQRENFWRAVEFTVATASPELASAFAKPVGPLGLTADFLLGKRVCMFNGQADELRARLGDLLLVEACTRKPLEKHLLLWSKDVTPEVSLAIDTIQQSVGVKVHVVSTGEDAAKLLLSLR